MNIEKFSLEDGTTGYKIKGTFASSRNNNGAYFDPVEVFSIDNTPTDFNFGHKDYETDYSTGTKVVSAPEGRIEGKMLRFTWDLETTNENFVAKIEAGDFGGFSPELFPKNKPVRSELGERFYRSGDLVWKNTAILGKDQRAGFVGANEYELEKFEAFEDVVIEKFEEEAKEEPKEVVEVVEEPTLEPTEEPKETFTLEDIKAVVKEAVSEHFATLEVEEPVITSDEQDKPENVEPELKETAEDKEEDEKFEQAKLETERFNSVAKAKEEIKTVELIQKGSEEAGDVKTEPNAGAINSLISKIF